MVSGCIALPDSNMTKLKRSNQEAYPSAGKNTRVILVPCHPWKYVPTALSGGEDISEFSVMITKITSRVGVS